MVEHISVAATEAIRIAAAFFPSDMVRQEALAKEIITAINLCEIDLGQEIMRRVREAERGA